MWRLIGRHGSWRDLANENRRPSSRDIMQRISGSVDRRTRTIHCSSARRRVLREQEVNMHVPTDAKKSAVARLACSSPATRPAGSPSAVPTPSSEPGSFRWPSQNGCRMAASIGQRAGSIEQLTPTVTAQTTRCTAGLHRRALGPGLLAQLG